MRRAKVMLAAVALSVGAGVGYCTGPATVERDMGVLERYEQQRQRCWEDQPCWERGPKGVTLTDDHGVWWPCWAIDEPCEDEG